MPQFHRGSRGTRTVWTSKPCGVYLVVPRKISIHMGQKGQDIEDIRPFGSGILDHRFDVENKIHTAP